MADSTENKRIVSDKWYLGETLGRGGYGFVKCGYHIKTKKAFALKFMKKASDTGKWAQEQAQQVATEINALKQINHENVLKLFAYNLKCSYPNNKGAPFDTVLLVLELASGGELFDVLYYTQALDIKLARTYFKQLALGLQAIHAKNITHRDLKPQNLLLTKKFQLKIADFGLAKIFEESDEKEGGKKHNVMRTMYVGTKGYQAPELLLKRKYTNKVDIFSCGVILFILMTGYPPLEEATAQDQWYRKICQKKYEKFWDKHRNCGVDQAEAKAIIEKCLCYQPTERYNIDELLKDAFLQLETYDNPDELEAHMKGIVSRAMAAKKKDKKKQEQLQTSFVPDTKRDLESKPIPVLMHDAILPRMTTWAIKPEVEPLQFCNQFQRIVEHRQGTVVEEGDKPWTLTGNLTLKNEEDLAFVLRVVKKEKNGTIFASFNFHGSNLFSKQNFVKLFYSHMEEYIDTSEVLDMKDTTYAPEDLDFGDDLTQW